MRFLRGRLAERGKNHVVIDVGGVGFQVFTPDTTGPALPSEGEEVFLHTRLNVREDSLSLFGFTKAEEAQLFDLLVGVSGVGPRVALGIISACRPKRFLEMILFEDVDGLSGLPGIGKKLSRRLALELRDKLGPHDRRLSASDFAAGPQEGDLPTEAVEALVSLGYGRAEAAAAIDRAVKDLGDGADVAELLKRGLQKL